MSGASKELKIPTKKEKSKMENEEGKKRKEKWETEKGPKKNAPNLFDLGFFLVVKNRRPEPAKERAPTAPPPPSPPKKNGRDVKIWKNQKKPSHRKKTNVKI